MRKKIGRAGVVVALSVAALAAVSREEALWEAAGRGDVAAVRKLLDEGTPVDAKTRYGATALSFACDKGQVEVVKLLLERGADPNAKDTFYGATPLAWASQHGGLEVARILVEKGAKDLDSALDLAVEKKDAALARAVFARGSLDAATRAAARTQAVEGGATEVTALIDAASAAAAPEPVVPVPADVLQTYAGTYSGDDPKQAVVVAVEGSSLVARPANEAPLVLDGLGDGRFRARDTKDVWLQFGGRGGTIEYLRLQRAGAARFFGRSLAPGATAGAATTAAAATPSAPAPAADASSRTAPADWPSFRGPGGSGIADGQGAPVTWDVEGGKGVRWTTAIPGIANSSPVVSGDRVFVTAAVGGKADSTFRTGLYGDVDSVPDDSSHTFRLYALDKKTGRVLWERVAHEGVPPVKRHMKSSLANPTPATDGKRVVALFGSGGLYAYDFDGRLLWKKELGVLDSGWFYDKTYQWGFGSSPVLYGNTVIVQVDIQKGSFVAAFDLDSGREAWRTPREEIPTWGTPAIVHGEKGDELVTNGTTIRGYDPKTGAPLWTLGPNSEVTVATPVAAEGLVFVTAGYPPVRPIYAIRPGSRGDLSLADGASASPAIAWSSTKDGTYIPTPLAYRGQLYTLHNDGRLSCYDAKTGALVYRERVRPGGSFSASPVAADGRLYFTSEEGEVFVVRAGPKFELLATNATGGITMATPAISDGLIIFRTLKNVVAVGG
jgi:outer membrane protein assembly factor BamB